MVGDVGLLIQFYNEFVVYGLYHQPCGTADQKIMTTNYLQEL